MGRDLRPPLERPRERFGDAIVRQRRIARDHQQRAEHVVSGRGEEALEAATLGIRVHHRCITRRDAGSFTSKPKKLECGAAASPWGLLDLDESARIGHMEIREARESDVSDILRLNTELHDYSARGVPSRLRIADRYDERARHAYVGKVLADATATYLIAVEGKEAIGYAEVHLQEPEQDPGAVPTRRAHLQALMVTTHRRNEGVGGALLTASEEWARQRGSEEMELENWIFDGDPGVFYEHAGYVPISEMRVKRLD